MIRFSMVQSVLSFIPKLIVLVMSFDSQISGMEDKTQWGTIVIK